jgi:hypothetical protein
MHEKGNRIFVKGGNLTGQAQFQVSPEDFHIDIPSLVRDKIAKEITVTIKVECKPR